MAFCALKTTRRYLRTSFIVVMMQALTTRSAGSDDVFLDDGDVANWPAPPKDKFNTVMGELVNTVEIAKSEVQEHKEKIATHSEVLSQHTSQLEAHAAKLGLKAKAATAPALKTTELPPAFNIAAFL